MITFFRPIITVLVLCVFTGIGASAQGVDLTFNPRDSGVGRLGGTAMSLFTRAFSIQADNKIVIGGVFNEVNGTARNNIARLNADGGLDTGFNPGTGADNTVTTLSVQPDGKILIAGYFTSYNGASRNRIARLNTDGSLDVGFDPGTGANNVPKFSPNFIHYNLRLQESSFVGWFG